MQSKLHVKKGDTVKIIAGDAKGQEGKILSVDRVKNRAFIEGINLVSKHVKPNAKNPQGGIVEKEASVHISNLKLIETGAATGKATKSTSKKKSKEVTK